MPKNAPVTSEPHPNFPCREVQTSPSGEYVDGNAPKATDGQAAGTLPSNQDDTITWMRSEEMPGSDKDEPQADLGVNPGQPPPNPQIGAGEVGVTILPKSSERVESVDLSGPVPGVAGSAADQAPSVEPCPTRACADPLNSRHRTLLHPDIPRATPIDDDAPSKGEKMDWTAG